MDQNTASTESRAETTSSDRDERSREVRLGIVMYGGVSLAIYIYGVSREFFHATQRDGVYGLVGAITDSDITVDVISGTSAGGINGILLAYALCNGYDFAAVSSLWSEAGDIADLLRAPGTDPEKCVSVLDSENKYLPKLRGAFAKMASSGTRNDAKVPQELDLFVTGTRVDGNIYTVLDDAGHAIDVKDYRTVFWLKHRHGRKEPFNPGFDKDASPDVTYGALARLAAVTSCFPAAFSPVFIKGDDRERLPPEDALLQDWGKIGGDAYFLDGGILDNKPFTPTLKAIFSRVANREVERRLFYVEPDPERFAREVKVEQPNAVQAAIAALLGIPGYESIAEDLKLLAEHNSKVEQYMTLLAELQPTDGQHPSQRDTSTDARTVVPPTKVGDRIYTRTRLLALANRVVRGILWEGAKQGTFSDQERKAARDLLRAFDETIWANKESGDALAFVKDLLDRFDVYARLRRVVRVIYLVYGRLFPAQGATATGSNPATESELSLEERVAYQRVLKAFNRQLKLYEILVAHMEGLIDDSHFDWHTKASTKEISKALWRQVEAAFGRLLSSQTGVAEIIADHAKLLGHSANERDWENWLPQDLLSQVKEALDSSARKLKTEIRTGKLEAAPRSESLLPDLERYEKQILDILPASDCARIAYDEFYDIDARIYPLELVADIKEKDVVRTVRVSPWDAQTGFSARPGSDKLAGDSVHHFGGFFKRSWRSNDVLWGRVDGLCQLIEVLLTRARLQQLADDPHHRSRIRRRLESDQLKPAGLFPRSGAATQKALAEWFGNLFGENYEARRDAISEKRFAAMRDLLIEAAQLQIIGEEVPTVIGDAIYEQSVWNSYRARKKGGADTKYDTPTWEFQSPDSVVDPLVAITAGAQATRKLIKDASPTQSLARPMNTQLGSFFVNNYQVGSEEVQRHIPTVVLLGILSKALLAVRNSVLQAIGTERRARVRSNLAYRILIDGPLHAFDLLVGVARSAPGARTNIRILLIVAPIVAVIVGVALYWKTMASGFFALLIWVFFPLAVLRGAVALFLRTDETNEASSPPGKDPPAEKWLTCLAAIPFCVLCLLAAATLALAVPASGHFRFFTEGIPKLRELEMACNVTAARAVLDIWEYRGLTEVARSAVRWDFALAAAYTAILLLSIARWLPRGGRLRRIAAFAALTAGALDMLENVAMLRMLDGAVTTEWAALSAVCAWPKFILLGGLVVLLIGAGARRSRNDTQPKAPPIKSPELEPRRV